MANKKIINATPKSYNGIDFKSLIEVMVYKTLLQEGFNPEYEKETFTLWEGLKPEVPFYNKNKSTGMLKLDTRVLLPITYTPDFTFMYRGTLVIIEAKGFENDVFPVKKKMFRKYLQENNRSSIYFEIYTKRQLLQAIEIIRSL